MRSAGTDGSPLLKESGSLWRDAGLLLLLIGGILLFAKGLALPGVTPDDGPGSAAYLGYYAEMLSGKRPYSIWCPQWLCGHSLVLLRSNPMEFFLGYPFAWALGGVDGMRWAWLTFTALSGAAMYWYLRVRLRLRAASLLGGFIYAVHPICVSFGVRPGHLEIPFFYAVAPLVLLAFHRLAVKPSMLRILAASTAATFAAFLDVERTLALAPFLILLHLYESVWEFGEPKVPLIRRLLRRFLMPGVAAGALAGGLIAFAAIPALIEAPYHYLFDPNSLRQARSELSFNNLFFLIDRNGALTSNWRQWLSGEFTANAGVLYLGLVPLLLLLGGALLRGRNRAGIWALVVTLLGVLSLWLSFGPYSIYDRTGDVADRLLGNQEFVSGAGFKWFLAGALFLLLLAPVWLLLNWIGIRRDGEKSGYGPKWVLLFCFSVLAILLLKPFGLLTHLPVYEHMRGVSYLFCVFPPLAMGILSAWFIARLAMRKGAIVVWAVAICCIAIVALDFLSYRAYFARRIPVAEARDVDEAAKVIGASPEWSRFMARETYSPISELIVMKSGRPNAWGWLNWDAPKGTGALFLERIYPNLHRPETIEMALRLAGMAGVRYITYSLVDGPPPPKTEYLRLVQHWPTLELYENLLFRPQVQLYAWPQASEDPAAWNILDLKNVIDQKIQRPGPERFDVAVDLASPALLVVSESYYPGWRVYVDGAPEKLIQAAGAFQGVALSAGKHQVIFCYERARYFAASAVVSVLAACFMVGLLFGRWRRTCLKAWVRMSRKMLGGASARRRNNEIEGSGL